MSKNRKRVWLPETKTSFEANFKQTQEVQIPVSIGSLAGFVEIDLIDAKSGRIKEHYEFPNMILTAGLDGLFSPDPSNSSFNDMINFLMIGTGSTAVSPADLSLDEPVTGSSSNGGFSKAVGYQTGSGGPWNIGNPYHWVKTTRVFLEDAANFPTLAELGWRNFLSSPQFQFTRVLIKDATGTPTTIAKTSADQLRVVYEFRLYPPTNQVSGAFVMATSEISHSWTGSAVDIDDVTAGAGWGFTLSGPSEGQFRGFGEWNNAGSGRDTQPFASASVPGNPTGSTSQWGWLGAQDNLGSAFVSRSLFPYSSGSFSIIKEAAWGPPLALFGPGGIEGIAMDYTNSSFVMAIYFTPPIAKTDLQRLKFIWSTSATASVTSSS